MVLRKLDLHMQRNELEPYFTPYTIPNSKEIKGLQLRGQNYKTLRRHGGKSL